MANACQQDLQEILRRAASRKTRRAIFTPDRPTKWHPTALRNPRDGEPFTSDNCWTFISEAIMEGAAVHVIELRQPAGKRGFVMELPGHEGVTIYVKLQLLSDVVLGRSFHESNLRDDEDE